MTQKPTDLKVTSSTPQLKVTDEEHGRYPDENSWQKWEEIGGKIKQAKTAEEAVWLKWQLRNAETSIREQEYLAIAVSETTTPKEDKPVVAQPAMGFTKSPYLPIALLCALSLFLTFTLRLAIGAHPVRPASIQSTAPELAPEVAPAPLPAPAVTQPEVAPTPLPAPAVTQPEPPQGNPLLLGDGQISFKAAFVTDTCGDAIACKNYNPLRKTIQDVLIDTNRRSKQLAQTVDTGFADPFFINANLDTADEWYYREHPEPFIVATYLAKSVQSLNSLVVKLDRLEGKTPAQQP